MLKNPTPTARRGIGSTAAWGQGNAPALTEVICCQWPVCAGARSWKRQEGGRVKAIDLAEGLTDLVSVQGTDCVVRVATPAGFFYELESFEFDSRTRTVLIKTGAMCEEGNDS
jgi:hypothetical protein